MSVKKEHRTLAFFKSLPKNIFSGFVVSLIALPLGLGLAMASDAPPIAGVITAIVGGLMVSLLGGSYVTITGPGNGLVGVVLVAVAALGLNGAYAAIICSGALLLILGFLRLGKLADFFPSSAIQGLLAAIGLIILGKQFHIMLGNKITRGSTIEYLLEIPKTLKGVFQYQDNGLLYAAAAGVLSLAIMVFYSKIRNKYLQLIPAPMWIVVISIAFSYYYELVLQQPNPIHPEYMLSGIPNLNQIVADIPTPDFSLLSTGVFWGSVLGLTLISSIESLLSIKAVDKLDPENRRSNVNKDLKALGLATVGSGFLGGLNVVTVIARSSVNVNNGASNRSANFFHATFLVLFIALFSTQLTRIPLPALMAILVFTGYKLASPDVVRNIFSIGKEQLIIFFITFFATLKLGLISGIAIGVIATLIMHIILNKSLTLFLRNIVKPNILMYKERVDNNYYISVKHFCTFLNFYKLKKKIEAIPENEDVVVDFSLCEFVDDTVMENLSGYQKSFNKNGGSFEVIGLDMHGSESKHPFALRRLIPFRSSGDGNLTKRQINISQLTHEYNLRYDYDRQTNNNFLNGFLFFRTKKVDAIYNRISDDKNSILLFDIVFSEGEFIAKEVVRSTMMYIRIDDEIPSFTMDKEGFLEKVYAFAGFKDINISEHADFSKHFYLLGEDAEGIKSFFNIDLIKFFEGNPYFHVESNRKSLLIFKKERLSSLKEIKVLYDFGKRLRSLVIDTHEMISS